MSKEGILPFDIGFLSHQLISIFVTSIGTAKQNKNKTSTFDIPCSTFDIKSVCSMAKDIVINDDVTFLYCTL